MNENAIHVMFEELKKSLSEIKKQLTDVKPTSSENNSTCKAQNYYSQLVTDMENTISSVCQSFFNIITDDISSSFRSERSKLEDFFASKSSKLQHSHKHQISIDIKSSKTFIAIIGLSIGFVFMSSLSVYLYIQQSKFVDNELKYKYIKSMKGIAKKQLGNLENVFEYDRDEEIISKIKDHVANYESQLSKKSQNLEKHELLD